MLKTLKEIVGEQVEFHELLLRMTQRDLALRYKQTVMGFGWAVFTPLINTAVFSVIFMRVAPIETPVPYPLYAFCGLLTWNFFASALRFSVTSLTSNANLVTKVYFPREVFPFSAIAVCAVDLAVGATVLVGLMIYYDVGVSPALLFLPVVIVMHIAFTAGVALLLAMANLFYRDVKYLFEVVITVWMFATSAVFPVDRVGGWLGVAINLNPMTHFIDAYRAVLLYHRLPDPGAFLGASVAAVLMLAVSWYVFHLAEFSFAESI